VTTTRSVAGRVRYDLPFQHHGFEHKEQTMRPYCPYCSKAAELVHGDTIYPHRPDLSEKRFWLCRDCDAYVGCHPGTEQPLGFPANAELRKLRQEAHLVFDAYWKAKGWKRSEGYAFLRKKLKAKRPVHIGQANDVTCRQIINLQWSK